MYDEDSLKLRLKKLGYRFTGQRNSVMNVIIEHSSKHLSSEEVYNIVKEINPEIGLATVYRTMMLLEKLGIITKIDLDDGVCRYELIKENEDHGHHHLICTKCNLVFEFEEDLLEKVEMEILKKNQFKVTNHRVKFYGKCKKCIE